jgi:hypothetical protein
MFSFFEIKPLGYTIIQGVFYFCSLNSKLNQSISWKRREQLKGKRFQGSFGKSRRYKTATKEKLLLEKRLNSTNKFLA